MPSASRPQTSGEEIANAVSHGLGLLAAMAVVPVVVAAAADGGGTATVAGVIVFGVSVIVLYAASTLYHAVPRAVAKRTLRVVDHAAIFLLIAGTYTPFTLGVLRGGWGWTLFGLVWGLCLLGIGLKVLRGVRHPALSLTLYLAAGWIAVVAAKPLLEGLPGWGLFWLLAGGLAYTGGVGFYLTDHRVRYGHFLWHLCVLAGTSCHFIAVVRYAAA